MTEQGYPGNAFRREVKFEPGHTLRRSKGDGSDYGIAAMTIRFLLHGEYGTTQFAMYTGWYPEKIPNGRGWNEWHHTAPSAFDLGAHWDSPWSEYMTEQDAHRDCDIRPGGKCWYDGSGLRAEPVMAAFFKDGEEAVWAALETEYRDIETEAKKIKEQQTNDYVI